MSTLSIKFGGAEFIPQPCGGLYWPAQNILVVSDLHFEKASHFAASGQFLPPYDTMETLAKLSKTTERLAPETIILLGDTFHDAGGHARLPDDAQTVFDAIQSKHAITWIDGNHDKGAAPDGVEVLTHIDIGGLRLTHIASDHDGPEISGHYHPAAIIRHKGHRVRRPAFIHDDKKLIMPAYGALTGGLDYDAEIIQSIIPNPTIYILGRDRIYPQN